ncbi:hypothetical protein L6164_033889 [Bauhinia variegata]|uniref:Uncharacterized protein n=1 Tax=Bauhinia variegata TaxID=167791 RepID=A0ACB9KT39_BAUVA|nr:hypothetical protein L6164_033889 [Bauhinia variegata]
MACTSDVTTAISTSETTFGDGNATTISAVHPDIIQTHILSRLDGPALASVATTCRQLYQLSSQEHLWAKICHSTWPSTNSPHIRHVISTFPSRSRSFFPDSFPLLLTPAPSTYNSHTNPDRTTELISAVDIFYRQQLIFSKVVETETVTGWFSCSPFRIDLLDPKDVVQTPIKCPKGDEACQDIGDDLSLSWIVIDPTGRRAVNLSSEKPVSVQRHWLSGEVHARFASVLTGDKGSSSEFAMCNLMITFGGVEGGDMHVREASLQMEDMDGSHMNGRDSLVILQRALEGKRGRRVRPEQEGLKRYQEFLNMKKERKERKLRAEGRLDFLCAGLAVVSFAGLCCLFVFWR